MVEIRFEADNLPSDIREKGKKFLKKVAIRLHNYMSEEAPVNTGRLRQSIQIMGFDSENKGVVVGVNADYASVVHEGRKPGTWPDMKGLRKWVDRKLDWKTWQDSEVTSLDGATYVVARKIFREGTNPNPFVERSIERLRDRYG